MTATVGLTQVSNSLATVVAAQALGYLKANTVLARLVARNWDNTVASYGQAVKIPFTGGLTVNDKAGGAGVTLQNPSDTSVTVTLDKHKEISFIIEDIAKALATPDYLAAYMQDGMSAMSEQIDGDIAALYSGFSQTIDATGAAGPLDEDDFREARRLLNAAKAPMTDRFAVLHEDAEAAYLNIPKATNRDYAEALGQAALDGSSGRFYGFNVFMDQKIAVATAVCKNLFFQRNAIALVTRPLGTVDPGLGVIQTAMSENGIGIRVTLGYNKDVLGMQCTIDCLYGVAELRDSHGVVVSTDEA